MSASAILFLGYDGVLHPRSGPHDLRHAPALAECLAFHPDVRLVLATRWADTVGLAQARAMLPAPLAERVDDSLFAALGYRYRQLTRPEQIAAYLTSGRGDWIEDWLVLDATPGVFTNEARVVRCHPDTGATVREWARLTSLVSAIEDGWRADATYPV